MITINNKTNATQGPYNGQSLAASASFTVNGSVAAYIADGKLLADILSKYISITFNGDEALGINAAALLMQLGQIITTDSDGANFSRAKQAPAGWTYQMRGFEFQTSQLSSVVNKDANNNDLNDASIHFFDASSNLLTVQADLDTLCVKTVVDIEPQYDYYLIGGAAKNLSTPTNDVRLNVIGVPDYPAPNGSKVMIQNVNMRYVYTGERVYADGRASKGLLYNNPIPHTNKIRFVVYHSAGDKIAFGVELETYKV